MLSTVRTASDAAGKILDPKPADLEHGLELHRDILVIDAYGFAAAGLVRAEAINPLIDAHAGALEIQDARENELMTGWAVHDDQFAEAAEAWKAAGVDCVWINAGEESNTIQTIFKRLARRSYATELRRDFCPRAVCPDDIENAKKEGKHCLYMTANGVPMPKRFISIEDELSFIRPLFQLGTRMAHITYNRANLIGDGCGETNDGGLTDFGRAVVAEMNRVGMIVDVAHSGLKTSLEAAQCSSRPMVASHTVCHAINPHCRAKTDEVMKAIVDTGGFIGICCIQPFLGRTWDIQALLDHIEYVARTFGVDHVAIGTDVAYTPEGQAAENAKMHPMPRQRAQWRSLWPEGSLDRPQGVDPGAQLSLAWTNFPMFTVGLVQRGFSDEDIAKIMGGNCMRVARDAWQSRVP
jgi:membrane dipeptidase